MSANLIEKRRQSKRKRFHVSQAVVNRRERLELIRRYSIPPVTDDEEETFVVRAAIWMIVLGMTPLILFHIFNFFYPDFLWIPVTPN